MKKIFFFLLFSTSTIFAQVKIGNNPSDIDGNSLLELESADNKVLVITRMSNPVMNTITPLQGAIVYNTTNDCVYTYTGSAWISLCEEGSGTNTGGSINVTTASIAPTVNNLGDFWINPATGINVISIWDGSTWISIDNNPRTGNGIPTTITAPTPSAGQIYVDENTGIIYAYDGTTWVASNTTLSANNGLTINNNTIELGGILIKPTVIETNATNTLAITGLVETTDIESKDIVVVNNTTGLLQKTNATNLFREEVTEITAIDGQLQFTPSLLISDSKKVNVYRNGVRIDFTEINNTTIEVEPEAICFAGDQIRIVQFF